MYDWLNVKWKIKIHEFMNMEMLFGTRKGEREREGASQKSANKIIFLQTSQLEKGKDVSPSYVS